MLSTVEALTQRLTLLSAFLSGIISTVFVKLQDVVMANGAAIISLLALVMSWYYQRRRDRREQARFEQEMKQ